METEEVEKKKAAEKAALLKRLRDAQVYMQLVAIIRTQSELDLLIKNFRNNEREPKLQITELQKKLQNIEDENIIKLKNLNKKTLEILIKFSIAIPSDMVIKKENFNDDASIETWLNELEKNNPYNYNQLSNLHNHLAELENKHKWANRWNKISEGINIFAQSISPLAQVPLVHIVMHPIMNGLYGLGYITGGIAMKYDPELGDRTDAVKSFFDKASFGTSVLSTTSAVLMIAPITWPVSVPLFLFSMLTSNILSTVSSTIDLVKAIKADKEANGYGWRIAEKSASAFYNIGNIVVAALMITAFIAAFVTPVGWAAGGAALAFGIGTAAACLGVFVVQKFCKWRADKAEKQTIEVKDLKKSDEPDNKNKLSQDTDNTLTKQRNNKLEEVPIEKPLEKESPTEPKNMLPQFTGFLHSETTTVQKPQNSADNRKPLQDNTQPKENKPPSKNS